MSAVSPYDRSNITLFTPDQVSNLALWLDAADINTIRLSNNSVTQWRDKSSNNHICISNANYTGTSLPTFSNLNPPYVNLAPNQALVTNAIWNYTTAWSCFVCMNTVSLDSRFLISPFNTVNIVLMSMNQGSNKIFAPGPGGFTSNISVDITGRHIEYTSAENTNAISNILWVRDGSLEASSVTNLNNNANSNRRMGIGANATFRSLMGGTYQLYEVLIYNRFISSIERQQIESYLAYKWNLQSNLPNSHPYRNAPYNIYYGLTISQQNLTNRTTLFPNQVSNLALWLDAADSSTVIRSGSNVSSVADKSGNGFTMTAVGSPIYNSNVLNGLGMIGSFATTRYLSTSNINFDFGTNDFAIFALVRFNTATGVIYPIISKNAAGITSRWEVLTPTGGSGASQATSARLTYVTTTGATRSITSSNVLTNTRFGIISIHSLRTGTQAIAYMNGIAGSAVSGDINPIVADNIPILIGAYAGNAFQYGGQIGEIIIYNGTITTAQRQQIEGYLAWKWGLQSNLPRNHPAFIQPLPVPIPTAITNYSFSPSIFSGLSVWLDAADLNSFTLNNSSITEWRDKSGNGRHASISGTVLYSNSNIIINGVSPNSFSVPFDIRRTTLSNLNIFIVYNQISITNPTLQGLWGNDLGGGWNRLQLLNHTNSSNFYRISGGFFGGTPITALVSNINNTNTQIYNASYSLSNVNNSFVYINGSVNATFTEYSSQINTTTSNIFFGTINNTNTYGNVAFNEIILFNRSININERQQIEGYLAWKWRLQTNLPSSHPFRSFPPG